MSATVSNSRPRHLRLVNPAQAGDTSPRRTVLLDSTDLAIDAGVFAGLLRLTEGSRTLVVFTPEDAEEFAAALLHHAAQAARDDRRPKATKGRVRSDFMLCELLGVRVVQVDEELPHPVLYCAEMGIAFISSGLTSEERADVAGQILLKAVAADGA